MAILYLGYHGNSRHFEFVQPPPKAATYYGGYSYKVDHNMTPKPWISIPNIIIYLETKFRPNQRIFVFDGHFVPWLPWQRPPFWILSTPQKLPHTTVDIPTNFHEVWWKESNFVLNPLPFLFPWQLRQSLSNRFRLFFGLSCSTRCGCCSYQVSSISVWRVTCYDHFCVFQFFSILAVSIVTAAILKIPKVVCTSTHSA